MMQVKTTGLKASDAFISKAMGRLNRSIPSALQKGVNGMITHAKNGKKYKTRNGGAERAIQGFIDTREWMLTFWINPAQVTVYSKSGKPYNYAWGLNDGTMSNYKQGAISPKITPSSKNGGIKADDFMGRAFEVGIKPLQREIVKDIERAFK